MRSAASATSSWAALGSLVDSRRWSSVPGRARARDRRLSGFRDIHPKTSTAAPTAPTAPTSLAFVRCRGGASSAAAPARAVAIVSGPTRCDPQRSCSFDAGSPVSYVPIETCSAPWYDVRSSPRSAISAGTSEAMTTAASRGTKGSDERRRMLAPVDAATRATATDGRSNGRRASGSPRFIAGRTANASASRIGPRTNGTESPSRMRGFVPEAVLIVPSGSRTAAPQVCGPWTRTPFWRAMPPRRSFSMRGG